MKPRLPSPRRGYKLTSIAWYPGGRIRYAVWERDEPRRRQQDEPEGEDLTTARRHGLLL